MSRKQQSKSGKSKKTNTRSSVKARDWETSFIKKEGTAVPTKLGAKLEEKESQSDSFSSMGSYDDSDDYVGRDIFKDYQEKMESQFKEQNEKIETLKEIIENSLDENIALI